MLREFANEHACVFLGVHDRQYLCHEGPKNVRTFAPTRSVKAVGLVEPTLLSSFISAQSHPRHQGGELERHRWLELALFPVPVVQSD